MNNHRSPDDAISPLTAFERAGMYLTQVAGSISGSGGHATAFNAAMVPVRGFCLPDDQSQTLLMEWNTKCVPPWNHNDLVAKIKSAHRDGRRTYGYLLADDDHRSHYTGRPAPSVPQAPQPRHGYTFEEHAEKAAKQALLPIPRPLTAKEGGAVAYLRECPQAGVAILSQNRRLMADDARPGCYLLTDGRTDGRGHRQYRNLDGAPFHHGQKSDNAKGSAGKGFFCLSYLRQLDPDELVFITEGSISLLEAVSCQWLCEGRARRWHFLAAHSAASTFNAEPDLLQSIAGHHVRILPDDGEAGRKGAKAWRDELRAVGCNIDFAVLPDGFQDLKKLLGEGSDAFPAIRSLLSYPTNKKGGQS